MAGSKNACLYQYWVLTVLLADLMSRRGYRGPAEVLLRRLTYGTPVAESPPIHVPSARLPVPADQPAPSPRRWFARR